MPLHRHVLPPTLLPTKALPEHALVAADATVWVANRAAADVQPSTIVFPRQLNSPSPKRTVPPRMAMLPARPLQRILSQLVKIAKLPSRRYGEETMLDRPYVMPAVCMSFKNLLSSSLMLLGLYYKLHGHHRPSEMKKQEIKRRKRIVPAEPNTSSQAPSVASYSPQPPRTLLPAELNNPQGPSSIASYSPQMRSAEPILEHSMSPDPSTTLESRETPTPMPRGPVAVDFTNYRSNPSLLGTVYPSAPSPRKRSRSASENPEALQHGGPAHPMPHRPNAISSILNPATGTHDDNIDPSLANLPARQSVGPSPNAGLDKAARKERLRREAEAMREQLLRKERELESLGDDDDDGDE
jgi:hypothetical protein